MPSLRSLRIAVALVATTIAGLVSTFAPTQALHAQPTLSVERPIPFDSAGRLLVITPALVSRLALSGPGWPVDYEFREARLFMTTAGTKVLTVQRGDGAVVRYALADVDAQALSRTLESAMRSRGETAGLPAAGGTGMVVSQSAGNAFVRNQAFLGLLAYGPATSALLSNSGAPAAVGGYFLAAGSAFFIAANTVKHRNVTRAQNLLASHAGFRGGIAGAGIAAITNADGGPAYGAPILAGALVGTVSGYRFARNKSDGEAATSALLADLSALTTLGISGALNAFGEKKDSLGLGRSGLQGQGKAAIAASIGAGVLGYAFGPEYARRAPYNVTAGDASVAFTAAAVGAVAALSFPTGRDLDSRTASGVATAGLLAGFVLSDRLLVRTADRTAANGTLAQLGAAAGALMGGGVAVMAETPRQGTTALIATGGALGLIAADRILEPGPDGGPLRGVLTTSLLSNSSRVQISLAPLATALAVRSTQSGRTPARFLSGDAPIVTSYPVVRIAW
jgi:hypothetical protein